MSGIAQSQGNEYEVTGLECRQVLPEVEPTEGLIDIDLMDLKGMLVGGEPSGLSRLRQALASNRRVELEETMRWHPRLDAFTFEKQG